ncbi:hypothetical protein Acr_14g0003150 [Actinidia rufa]|uniref:K Homology domain-containing protein n=1 Tax=Actinidia rufa TaxID=165716 RepID=A0A7J0FR93_9ERIC|nr:hypothetical protein Acr_14g0003150 [Actinidia rufa]
MAEPAKNPVLPTPASEDPDNRSKPEKRPREEDGNDASGDARGDAPPAKRQVKSPLDIVYRIVVPSRQIGKVIGKVGARIQKIREETKATIKIADAIAAPEMVVEAVSDQIEATRSHSELCLSQVKLRFGSIEVRLRFNRGSGGLIEPQSEATRSPENPKVPSDGLSIVCGLHKQPTHHLPCGQRGNLDGICPMICDIGRCHLQEVLQGVLLGFLKVARKVFIVTLPYQSKVSSYPCTKDSIEERERIMIVTPVSFGRLILCLILVEDLGYELLKSYLIAGTQAGGLIGVSGQNIEKLRISSGATITVLAQNQLPLYASAHESDRVVQVSYTFFTDYVTLEMMISETIIGGLIGRCGSNISKIRSESGATIKVYGGKGEQKFRQLHIGGSAQQVAMAKQRVDEYTYSQFIQQAGAQHPVDPSTGMMSTLAPYFTVTNTNQVPAYPGLPFHAPPL